MSDALTWSTAITQARLWAEDADRADGADGTGDWPHVDAAASAALAWAAIAREIREGGHLIAGERTLVGDGDHVTCGVRVSYGGVS